MKSTYCVQLCTIVILVRSCLCGTKIRYWHTRTWTENLTYRKRNCQHLSNHYMRTSIMVRHFSGECKLFYELCWLQNRWKSPFICIWIEPHEPQQLQGLMRLYAHAQQDFYVQADLLVWICERVIIQTKTCTNRTTDIIFMFSYVFSTNCLKAYKHNIRVLAHYFTLNRLCTSLQTVFISPGSLKLPNSIHVSWLTTLPCTNCMKADKTVLTKTTLHKQYKGFQTLVFMLPGPID